VVLRKLAEDAARRVEYVEARERAMLEASGGRETFMLAGMRFQAIGSRLWLAYMTLWVCLAELRRR
jgi:hypothetical protein